MRRGSDSQGLLSVDDPKGAQGQLRGPADSQVAAWDDARTNVIQPFWALPVLDIIGFYVVQLVPSGIIIGIGLTFM